MLVCHFVGQEEKPGKSFLFIVPSGPVDTTAARRQRCIAEKVSEVARLALEAGGFLRLRASEVVGYEPLLHHSNSGTVPCASRWSIAVGNKQGEAICKRF